MALRMMKNKKPTWRAIASTVKITRATLCVLRQTTDPQTHSAATGMRQNNATIKTAGGAGSGNRCQANSNRKYAVGLRNTASQSATPDRAWKLCGCWGIKACLAAYDPSAATRPTRAHDCNRDAMAGFAAAHG